MRYVSTRGGARPHTFLEAVAAGLAPDGGLFVPETFPDVSGRLAAWERLDYAALAAEFLALFADEPGPEAWRALCRRAYGSFAAGEVAPLVALAPGLRVLELFHGPTLAFKDFALQLLGLLHQRAADASGRGTAVLGATSGDTGSAAIHGCLGHPRIRSFILYPAGRIAPLQERQMACTDDPGVFAIPVPGTFDDAQRVVKAVFGDTAFAAAHGLAAVNSINVSRILAQSVYYLWAWLRLPPAEREGVEFIVPTGNFGNVLAGWLLRRMGLPGLRFRVATNRNDILWRHFERGDYSATGVEPTLAPSMDIQAASNFERYAYYALGADPAAVRAAMGEFGRTGRAALPRHAGDGIRATRMDDAAISGAIRDVYQKHGYVVCPHTACAFAEPADGPAVVLATAHPAKFPEAVRAACGVDPRHPALDALIGRPLATHPLPADADAVKAFIRAHAV